MVMGHKIMKPAHTFCAALLLCAVATPAFAQAEDKPQGPAANAGTPKSTDNAIYGQSRSNRRHNVMNPGSPVDNTQQAKGNSQDPEGKPLLRQKSAALPRGGSDNTARVQRPR